MFQKTTDEKLGYLYQNFKLFHIKDQVAPRLESHYHEFDKIIFFMSGKVTYQIEGKSYLLSPGDLLLVSHHELHKAIIDPSVAYERIILWVNPSFLETYRRKDADLAACFQTPIHNGSNRIALPQQQQEELIPLFAQLKTALHEEAFANELLAEALFIQILITINRLFLEHSHLESAVNYHMDPKITELIAYINSHLDTDLTIDHLARALYLSKYYLMHKFKSETGYTIHNFILQRRLFLATDLIQHGMTATQAAARCGFTDYSTFVRSFKKTFHKTPSEL